MRARRQFGRPIGDFQALRFHRILEGTNEIMHLIIARHLLDDV